MKSAVAAVAMPFPTSIGHLVPGFARSSRTERLLPALGHDRPERGGLRSRFDHHLAADGEADPADPVGVDIGPTLQEGNGRVDVSLALPAEEIRVALALALAATVEHQDAVAVPREHLRPLLRGGAAGEGDHRRAVPRRDVPALQAQAVAGRELDVLVRRAEVGGRHLRAGDMRHDVGDRHREEDQERSHQRACGEEQPAEIPPPAAVVSPP